MEKFLGWVGNCLAAVLTAIAGAFLLIAACIALAIFGPAYLNGNEVDLYEMAYTDHSRLRTELLSSLETSNSTATDLGIERLYATCTVANVDNDYPSAARMHIATVHDMELLGVTCESVSEAHGSGRDNGTNPELLELSRRAGIEGVSDAVNHQRTNIRLEPLASDPGPAPELDWWDKRTTRKKPLRKIGQDIQNQILDLDQELKRLEHINGLLADEYADLRLANLTAKLEAAEKSPTEATIKRLALLLERPTLAEQIQRTP